MQTETFDQIVNDPELQEVLTSDAMRQVMADDALRRLLATTPSALRWMTTRSWRCAG